MRRGAGLVLVLAMVLFVAVPVALAYTGVQGAVKDAFGNPWTQGGTVNCVQNSTGTSVGSGTIDANGAWLVYVGSPSAMTCTIDPAPGPGGDPAPFTCNVPGGGGGGVLIYDCGTGSTGTGPTAVSLAHFAGQALPAGAGSVAVIGALAGSAVLWLRRRL